MNRRPKQQPDTKTRILDAAERLFSARGFRGTSIQRLAAAAKVNQAAVNYHFGSKAGLLKKVVDRRLGPVNRRRMQRLNALRQAAAARGRRPTAQEVLQAFIEPALTLKRPFAEKKYFLAIAGRAISEPDARIRELFAEQLKPSFAVLFENMKEALPDLPEKVLLWRLHFAVGAMAHFMGLCSVNLPSSDLLPPMDDISALSVLLLDFVAGGMTAPAAR